MEKPLIAYPCHWSYRLIGEDEQLLRAAAVAAADARVHSLSTSNRSSKGKYVSLNLDVLVESEDERLAVFHQLENDPAVRIVI